ncbi:hypothetical protein OG298_40220 [Streptomyces sp. NBC_01005]|uniref:hypothetical protein n=1 Tax=unclassified Streptomyces TaxID=2593676 RepID=UPI0038646CD5|nr:hypothetical protein OG298_40220 [Streptomyces sp. NBC_01005]WTC99603.1 hypothetical protein OH736_40235 [Streptomyces sp. NBC_01650]
MPWGLGANRSDDILIYAWNDSSSGNSWRLVPVAGSDYYLIRNTVTNKCIRATTSPRCTRNSATTADTPPTGRDH